MSKVTLDCKEVSLSAEARLELAACFYAKWSEAYDSLKEIRAATWNAIDSCCPKNEWPQVQAMRIEYAQREVDKWKRLSDEVMKYSPLIEQMRDANF